MVLLWANVRTVSARHTVAKATVATARVRF
jgi:hypothetical protein